MAKCQFCIQEEHYLTCVDIEDKAGIFILHFECSNCTSIFVFHSSSTLPNSSQYEISCRLIKSSVLAGLGKKQFTEQMDLAGVNHLSASSFQRSINEMQISFEEFTLWLNIDARWTNPYGYNSEQGTITFLDVISCKVLWTLHYNRSRSEVDKPYWNYKGSAKGMEGQGVAEILKQIKQEGLKK